MTTGKPEASGWREKALAAGVIVERLRERERKFAETY